MKHFSHFSLYAVLAITTLFARAENEIGFVEKFALAPDREAVLAQLIPGSEEYYFYHALQYQNTKQADKFKAIMTLWGDRFPQSAQRKVIENRAALLSYDADPQATLKFLRDRLHLFFTHRRVARDAKPNYDAKLDPSLITREVYLGKALGSPDYLGTAGEEADEALVRDKAGLSTAQRRLLLARLTRPDVPNLLDLIVTDLKSRESNLNFGEFPIHRALLPEQLDELARRLPGLLTNQKFIFTRVQKLAPSADADPEFDVAEHRAWLDRVWAYVEPLAPAFNSLKANVLFQRLQLDRRAGIYDEARFLTYLKIPRRFDYVNPEFLKAPGQEPFVAYLEMSFEQAMPTAVPIAGDEGLVYDYFLHLLPRLDAATIAKDPGDILAPWTPYVRESWLKQVLAEAMITNGVGDPERWASLINPTAFQRLKDRVDLDFAATNPPFRALREDVGLDLIVKNAPKVIVKLYEVNTLSYFLTQQRDLNTDLPLDGLVANQEKSVDYSGEAAGGNPFLRVARHFDFPELKDKRGAWVIEFIGGGKSSRALIRKGQWSLVQRVGAAGDEITVLDDAHQPVKDAAVWLEGRRYATDAQTGRMTVPFTQQPGRKGIILADAKGEFATLATFEHHAEEYQLSATFALDREQLLAGRDATLVLHATLLLQDAPVPIELLKETTLSITSTNLDGVATTTEVRSPQLEAAKDYTYTFRVPDRLATIGVTFKGKVEKMSKGGEKQDLSASYERNVNAIDKTDKILQGELSKIAGSYVFEALGKNGEPLAGQTIEFGFHHHDFLREIGAYLATDAQGRVVLGPLEGIDRVKADLPDGRELAWTLGGEGRTWSSQINGKVGEVIPVPWGKVVKTGTVSLLEVRGGVFTADRAASVSTPAAADGIVPFILLKDLPAGDYSLAVRDGATSHVITIRVTAGDLVDGWLESANRALQIRNAAPLQILGAIADENHLHVQLANAGKFARVHVVATRFLPVDGLSALGGFARFEPGWATPDRRPNLYSSGRDIGDEYRYILERRAAKIFPGNMLTRPGLLLNPWAVRETDLQAMAQKEAQQAGATGGARNGDAAAPRKAPQPLVMRPAVANDTGPDIDFLATAAPASFNLVADNHGVVSLDRSALGDRQYVQIYAEDMNNAAWMSLSLDEVPTKFIDLRLAHSLDPAQHFTEKKETTLLTAGQTLKIDDLRTSEMETYDSLASVHALFTTLNADAKLARFSWLLQWPQLKDEEKRAKYSEFACHELNFFLSRKDPEFFKAVIAPYLRNKKDKTFLDDYLLESDLHRYLEPWAFGQLNVAEQALLGRRLPQETASVARHLRELWELQPVDTERERKLFETALRGRSLQAGAAGEFSALKGEQAQQQMNDALRRREGGAPSAKPMPAGRAFDADANDFNINAFKLPAPRSMDSLKKVLDDQGIYTETAQHGIVLSGYVDTSYVYNNPDHASAGVEGFGNAKTGTVAAATSPNQPLDVKVVYSFGDGDEKQKVAAQDKAMEGFINYGQPIVDRRQQVRQYFRALGTTQEWAENNYFELPIARQNGALIPVNAFWKDYAAWDGAAPFLSKNMDEVASSFAEMMLALGVLDLPFDAAKNGTKAEGAQFTLTAGGPLIAYHREIEPAAAAKNVGELLVSQNFYRYDDRYRQEGNEQIEKYVTGEFLAGVVYGAKVVVTNPTSSPQKLDVLMQIPQGALPVLGAKPTDSQALRLEPSMTKVYEYAFYFPLPNAQPFPQFPVNISRQEENVAAAAPVTFKVVPKLSEIDTNSWEYVSQEGTDEQVFAFLDKANLERLDLEQIAWRAEASADFFHRIIALLAQRHVYHQRLYAIAVQDNDAPALREWLKHYDVFLAQCGPWLDAPILSIDPIQLHAYEHLEYSPLINQRTRRVGAENRIANPALLAQYRALMTILAYKPALDAGDQMSVVYYLFLQDRVEEALARFHAIKPEELPTRLQHDYFRCYAAFYEENLAEAKQVAAQYANYPVDRWRKIFADVTTQLAEIEGKDAATATPGAEPKPDREKQQAALAATEPTFDFKMENRQIALTWKNLHEVTVNYYLMDPEFLFSSSPFVTQDPSRFSIIKPSKSAVVTLPDGKEATALPLPEEFAQANVLVEILGAGQRKAEAYHANTLQLNLAQNYGRLELLRQADGKPVSKAYVKVYARLQNGVVRFYKDGYTDLRGKFDYASLNSRDVNAPVPAIAPGVVGQPVFNVSGGAPATSMNYQMLRPDELGQVDKLAILIMSEKEGALVREAAPPSQ